MMNKLNLIISPFFLMPLFSKAQSSEIAFVDWDSIRNQVDLYKTNELEIALKRLFKKLIV
jgi:hypothetical protein